MKKCVLRFLGRTTLLSGARGPSNTDPVSQEPRPDMAVPSTSMEADKKGEGVAPKR